MPESYPACCYAEPSATLAEKLYATYNAAGDPATAGLNYQGKPCPMWVELPEAIRGHWYTVVLRTLELANSGTLLGNEAREEADRV